MKTVRSFCLLLFGLFCTQDDLQAQEKGLWHGIEREIHYKPDGEDFVLVNGRQRFNRALYGGNTAFRAEAGDLPEFALYLPGMGGNLKFGLIRGKESKWLIDADKIDTRYRPGSMRYTIKDEWLGSGEIKLTVLATYDKEGLIVKTVSKAIPPGVQLLAVYGGATGSKFSRDGDIGADPESSFYLKPEYCRNNIYKLDKNRFTLFFGAKSFSEDERHEIQYGLKTDKSKLPATLKQLSGMFPDGAVLKLVDARQQETPLQLLASGNSTTPAVAAHVAFTKQPQFFYLQNGVADAGQSYQQLPQVFASTEAKRKNLAGRIKVNTPDPFINTLGGALAVAADAVWEAPSFLHGAVAWRMRLPGWRGAYLGDVLGWHDRARTHFSAYALSQVTEPAAGPIVMDTALHLARHAEKMGTSVFSSGYISRNPGGDKRPHHYDMNLGFIDQLLNHFLWTGDTAYVKTMWPLLKRHLDWEDRNFDIDGDHLYDAYAAIWASDALQYSGGGVTHSSAYNYKAYKMAGELALLVGEDGELYRKKADSILTAINSRLWMHSKGVYAEYKDLLGKQLLHSSPAVWTIYHAIDSKVPDPFQAYQSLQYIKNHIPHIPIRAKGLTDTTLHAISTTAWQPYTWSLNNVAMGETMHTALAYWQGGRKEDAYKLFKSSLIESMFLGASPGNFQQLSFYDAMRGELYRDFADVVGTTARSLVEGLFGVFVDALRDTFSVHPGFPAEWKHASVTTPDMVYSFKQVGLRSTYSFRLTAQKKLNLVMKITAPFADAEAVVVNGKKAAWRFDTSAIGSPVVVITAPAANSFNVVITWMNQKIARPIFQRADSIHELRVARTAGSFENLFDPQGALRSSSLRPQQLVATVNNPYERKTFFLKVKQGKAQYWYPVLVEPVMKKAGREIRTASSTDRFETIDLSSYFNDEVTNIFKNQYLSPRPEVPTLQLPTQGIGNWAYPLVAPAISDSGLRKRAGIKNEFTTGQGIPFTTPSQHGVKNILFTSQWDNYPDSVVVPLTGRALHVYFLMAGSTNPMQSHIANGEVTVQYRDGSEEVLALKNPENWWPIEQDLYNDGFAFHTGAPVPVRVYFKTGEDTRTFNNYTTLKGFSNRAIDGGAGTVLDLPLDPTKEIKSLTLKAVANDVVIGLMSLTLVRPN
ncbi:MAG TPA: DUF4450 domain-containing protein [Flavisolibacter sp.]|jgi:hypothetical protein|nr:DUF4450 domain-containing protein [Flavisolibacter sp.]